MSGPVVDCNEYGVPITDPRNMRLGAGSVDEADVGLYVRFETGFGTNVHIGYRKVDRPIGAPAWKTHPRVDVDEMVTSIGGWRGLCALVDVYREREVER